MYYFSSACLVLIKVMNFMVEEILYGLIFLLIGIICIHLGKSEPKDKKDPFLVRISLLTIGFFSVLSAFYLFFKAL